MNEDEEKKLETMLRQRRVEPASPDLTARIISMAKGLPQRSDIGLWQTMRQWFVEFHLPKPGYVLAGALIVGIMLGFGTSQDNGQISDTGSVVAGSYLAGDEGLL